MGCAVRQKDNMRLYKGMQMCAKNVQGSVRPHESMGGNVNICERVQVYARGCKDIHNHSKSVVYIRVHSCCCAFYGF